MLQFLYNFPNVRIHFEDLLQELCINCLHISLQQLDNYTSNSRIIRLSRPRGNIKLSFLNEFINLHLIHM